MEKLKKELQRIQELSSQGGSPSPQRLKAVKQEVAQTLKASRGDPCYPVYFEKELIKRIEGFDMPWVKCVPLEISVVWDVYENGGRRNENQVRYTLEESYPGYMKIEYHMKKMDQINGFYIRGPSPQRLDRVNASMRDVSATFHVYVGPDKLEGIITTNDPSDFTFHEGTDLPPHALIAVSNNVPPGGIDTTIIRSSIITPSEKLVKYPVAGILETPTIVEDSFFSIEEIRRGLREGKLVKQFTIHEFTDYGPLKRFFRRDGTATVYISFPSMNERWHVMVNTINILGYGSHDSNYGIQVHTERMIEIVIENEEFKSAEGKTSFVSIKPYSIPAGMFRCQEKNIEVIGSGTAAEADWYDQIRHTARFNPPKNPHDEALKQEWSKIEKHTTPYVFPQTYLVKGTKSDTQVDLFFPKNSGYVVSHRCVPSDAFLKKQQQKWQKKSMTNERGLRRDYDRFLFPETIRILLEDDWYTEIHYTTKFYGPNVGWKECQNGTPGAWTENTDQIRVKRIE